MTVPTHSLLFALLSSRAAWLAARQGVLAQNLAHADTPGFQPLDLVPFERTLGKATYRAGLELARTAPGHLPGTSVRRGPDPAARRAGAWEMAPSGNAVVLEEQMEKLARTQIDHQLATSLYGKHVAMLRTALAGPST